MDNLRSGDQGYHVRLWRVSIMAKKLEGESNHQ